MIPKSSDSTLSPDYCCTDCRIVHLYVHFGKHIKGHLKNVRLVLGSCWLIL